MRDTLTTLSQRGNIAHRVHCHADFEPDAKPAKSPKVCSILLEREWHDLAPSARSYADCLPVVQPLLTVLTKVTEQIKGMERELVQRSKKDYPVTQRLQQIAGVGPLTALCFVLKIGDPQRFSRGRDVGAYLGLCPRRDQSGGTDKQLRISKCGDGLLRRLLVSAAHYVLGPFGPACALREQGQRLTSTGSAREKKRAVVAVARKLAVLLLSLWKRGTDYEPRITARPAWVMKPA